MTDLDRILAATPWRDWAVQPISGDASARSYVRLVGPGLETVVVMNSGAVPTGPFVTMARYLNAHGFCAPEILHDASPFLVLSDLGPNDLASVMAQTDPLPLYRSAVDVLLQLRSVAPPELSRLTPHVAGDMVRITATHYARDGNGDALAAAVTRCMTSHAPEPATLALRDFHVENLIWRGDQDGTDKIGLLDFQDAFVAPDGYDLASLLRDVRRDVSPKTVSAMTAHYCKNAGLDPQQFAPQLACLGAQRNLRILGVFARLIREMGKPKYAALMPRVWANLMADLAHPALADLRDVVSATLPEPHAAGFA